MMTQSSVIARIEELSALGRYDGGIDRGLFTRPEREARERFAGWARAGGFELTQDAVGNLFARRPGTKYLPAILSGSHLDTVKTGGAYDGAYGVVAAMCALDALAASGAATAHPVEAVAWAGEEGSNFPLGCLGSGTYAGLNSPADVGELRGENGARFLDALDGEFGLLPGIARRETFPRPAAYVEIHVEQGPIMEKAGARLGLVTAIAGQRRYEIEVIGESGHAGTVPMEGRCDALAAAAEVMVELENVARLVGGCVLTIGYLVVEPNQTNVIPSRVVFRVDLRSVDEKKVERLDQYVLDSCARINTGRCATTHIKTLEARNSVPMDERLRKTLRSALEPLGERVLDLPSGAGHDAMCIAAIAPTAMIFVPSVGGKSHVVEEFTTPGDLELGVEALTRSIVAIDASLTGGT